MQTVGGWKRDFHIDVGELSIGQTSITTKQKLSASTAMA
jgi:hypothetical protein